VEVTVTIRRRLVFTHKQTCGPANGRSEKGQKLTNLPDYIVSALLREADAEWPSCLPRPGASRNPASQHQLLHYLLSPIYSSQGTRTVSPTLGM
jgi:hypothetical protein